MIPDKPFSQEIAFFFVGDVVAAADSVTVVQLVYYFHWNADCIVNVATTAIYSFRMSPAIANSNQEINWSVERAIALIIGRNSSIIIGTQN